MDSKFKTGQVPWNKGLQGEKYRIHYITGFLGGRKPGFIISKKTKEKLRKSSLGNKNRLNDHKSVEERMKISSSLKKGYREGKIKLGSGIFKIGHIPLYRPPIGKEHWFYSGGKKEKGITFSEWLKIRSIILLRDENKCVLCNASLKKIIREDGVIIENLHIHHLDWNKKNNSLENLVTLCVSCHTKIHTNNFFYTEFEQKFNRRILNAGVVQ